MPKRFYFTNSAAPVASPGLVAGVWDQGAARTVIKLGQTKAGANIAVAQAETDPTADWDVLLVQAISDPVLQEATLPVGSTYAYVRGRQESSTSADFQTRTYTWILQPDGTRRATITSATATAEWPTTMSAQQVNGSLIASVTVQPGDRIVFEFGYRSPSTQTLPGMSYTGTVRIGGTDATDLVAADTGTAVTTRSPWVEFADDAFVTAFTAPPPAVGDVAATRGATAAATAQRTDTAAVSATRTATTSATGVRSDDATVSATRTATATAAASRSDAAAVSATRTAASTATASAGTVAAVTAASGPAATATATTSSPAEVTATRTATATATAARTDVAEVSATRTATASAAASRSDDATVTATRTATSSVTPVQPTATVSAVRTATASTAATRSDAAGVSATRTATSSVTPVQPTAAVSAVRGPASTVTGLRTDVAAVAAARTATAAASGLRTDIAAVTSATGSSAAVAAGAISALGSAGAALNPVVWAVDRGTREITGQLPAWTSLNLSPVENSPGSCTLRYPAGVPGFDLLFAGVSGSPQRDQEIEVWLDGSRASRRRWLLQQKSGDDVALGEVWTFTGHGLDQLLDEIVVGPQGTDSQELVFTAATYGTMLITAVQQAKARSTAILPGVTWDFTTALDSNGVPWAGSVSELVFAPDDTLLAVAQAGVEFVLGDFELTADRVLRAFNPGTRGVDRALGNTPLRLQAGVNLDEAARRESSRVGDAATAALGKGADGQYQWAVNTTAQAERGRRVEVPVDAGQQSSAGAVLATTQARLTELRDGVSERTHGVVFGPGLPVPGVDFDLGDWALSVTGNTATRQRIAQWTLTFDRDRGAAGSVRTNTLIEDRLSRLTRRLDAVQRGAVVVGTSTARPDVDDGKAPAQVLGLTASSSAYPGPNGISQAAVVADWADVVTNADGTAASDIVGYTPQYRYGAGQGLPTGWTALPQTTASNTDHDGFVAARQVEVRVAAVDRYGRAGAWSTPFALTTGADTTAPPTPSAAAPFARAGVVLVPWDGRGSAGEAQPPDYLRTELHRSTAAGFTPDRPLVGGVLNEAASTTYRGDYRAAMTVADEVPTAAYGTTYYYRLVSVDRSGNASAPSAVAALVSQPAQDGELGGLSVGKLFAGIINVVVGIGQRLYAGDPGGPGWEGDPAGFRFYTGVGAARRTVLNFVGSSGLLSIVGRLLAGAGIGTGATVAVEPTTASVDLYPSAALSRVQLRGITGTDPNGTAGVAQFQLRTLNASGGEQGAQLRTSDDNVWLFHRDASGAIRGGRLYLGGEGETNGALLGYTGADFSASVRVLAGGDIFVDSPSQFRVDAAGDSQLLMTADGSAVQLRVNSSNRLLLNSGNAQLISGGTVKSFVIDHPTDADRWLVHACTESPTAGVEYAGTAVVEDHLAVVELPHYFEALCEVGGRSVHLTPELAVVDGRPAVCNAAPTPVLDGRFHIVCPAPDGTRVHWLVKATRRAAEFEAEPRRADVDVHGDGPYRHLTPRTS